MSQFSNRPHDQAQVLRALAQPAPSSASAPVEKQSPPLRSQHKIDNAPHVVLISETHSLQGVLPLALHLVQHVSAPQNRTLLVDLSPAASRLADAIACNPDRFHGWAEHMQPLWTPALHGRTLHAWKPSRRPADLLAQLETEFPSAEQMPRICEQLVRQLGQQRATSAESEGTHYKTVVLLSEFVGVPLDSAAWQAADEVWLFHDLAAKPEQIHAGLAARLSPHTHGQRIVLLMKQPPTLRNWASRRRIERLDGGLDTYAKHWKDVERFQIAWPQVPARLARSISGTAHELALQLLTKNESKPRSTRQAS